MSEPVDPRAKLSEHVFGFMRTQMVATAARLGIPDRLEDGDADASAIASACEANVESMTRFLRALASIGLVREVAPERFGKTPMSTLLASKTPGSMHDFAVFMGIDCYPEWADLVGSVKTGVPAVVRHHGASHFELLSRKPEANDRFNRAMASGTPARVAALTGLDLWKDVRTVVDVGGGNGAMLLGLLAKHPHLEGTVFDLAHVVAADPRLRWVAGSFFDDVPPSADVFLLSRILHDWNDADARRILATVRKAAQPGARLVIVDHVLSGGNVHDPARLIDLQMLVMLGGRERTEDELRGMLASEGFELVRVVPAQPMAITEARAV